MCWHSARRQVCRLLGDIIVLPVVPYHSSAEFPPPQLCWQKELSEHSLVCFQQVRWISQQRGFKLTCLLCLKQMKVLLNKSLYERSYGSTNGGIGREAWRYKLAKPSSGTVASGTHCCPEIYK